MLVELVVAAPATPLRKLWEGAVGELAPTSHEAGQESLIAVLLPTPRRQIPLGPPGLLALRLWGTTMTLTLLPTRPIEGQ